MKRAKPILLEPMMSVEVTTPEEYLGDVMGNLSSRRGRIESMGPGRQRPGRQRERAALGDVRLRHRPALDVAGPGGVHACSSSGTRRSRRRSPRRWSRAAAGRIGNGNHISFN